jgi:hypothetical protein
MSSISKGSGFREGQVSIEVHQNTLTLRGERKHDAAVKEDNYHRVERRLWTLPALLHAADPGGSGARAGDLS